MPLYANFVPNPSFEVNTTGWASENGGSLSRTTSAPTAGTNVLSVSYVSSGSADFGGAKTTVAIEPGQPAYTLSLTLKAITENHGAANNAGVKVTVYDLLPGAAENTRQQIATQTFARTTNGRVAIRNFTPRPTADRLVVTVTSASTYYKPPETTTQSTGLVWTTEGLAAGGGITSPSGTYVDPATWNGYSGQGYTVSGLTTFVYRDNFQSLSYNAKQGTWSKTTQTAPAVYGGTVSFTVDAVQIEAKTTESTYVDGTVAGYAWSGTPHASPTLNMAQLQATATGASTGTLIFGLVFPIEAHATAVSVGTIETVLKSVGATAFAASTGRLDVWNYGPVTATGTALSTGDIVLAALVDFEMAGTATSTGTADSLIAVITFATATTTSAGTLDIGLPPDAEAHGTAASTGTLMAAIAGVMEAHGTIISTGLIEIGEDIPAGAFADFAIYGVTETDPRMTVTANSNGGTNTGATGQEWVRIYSEFIAPDEMKTSDGTLWRRAAYVVPGIKFTGLPAGSWQEFTRVQLEIASPTAEPTPYMDGASVRALVYPDRLNLAPSTVTVVDHSGPTYSDATPTTSPIASDDAPARLVEIQPGLAYSVLANLTRLRPQAIYTVSLYMRLSAGMADAGFQIRDPNGIGELAPVVTYADADPTSDIPGWRRLRTDFTAPDSGSALMAFTWTADDPHTVTQSFEIAGILVEAGTSLQPYFPNPGNNPDIRYHQNSTGPENGVFHYQDRARKTYILNEALKEHVPSGIGINEPEFGLIPYYDS